MSEELHTSIDANTLGKYRLIAGLGRGGMAAVHLAVVHGPSAFNKLVVIKQIHDQYAEDPEILGMFLDEARLGARLNHPNVVQTNEVGQEGSRHFLAMEYLDGQPLNRINQRLAKHGGLPLPMYLKVIVDLLGGLHYAHELADYDGTLLGVVHRDITPHNIFVTYDGVVKIVDFGIAKARHASTETRAGIIKGKLAYMAPEQARSEEVDRRTDVFAVGVMLWEAATGTRPWKGADELGLLKGLLGGHFPAPRSVNAEVPEALEAIILKATAHDRQDRYASAADLQAALEAYLETTAQRPQPRELGKLITLHFAAERAKIKAVIEEQLQPHSAVPVGVASLPIIDHATSPHGDFPGQSGSDPSLELVHAPSTPPAFAGTVRTAVSLSRLHRRALVATGALLAGAAMVVAMVAATTSAPQRVEAAASVAPVTPPLATVEQVHATVQVRLSAKPAQAHVFLDDEPLPGNPFSGELRRDDRTHRIRVEAPGFVTWTERITLDKDRDFEIALAPASAAPSTAAAPVPQAASPASPSQGGRKQPRNLDGKNPYPGR